MHSRYGRVGIEFVTASIVDQLAIADAGQPPAAFRGVIGELSGIVMQEISARPKSVEDLFRMSYSPLLRTLTVVALGDSEAAADALQDAFVRAHVRWSRISRYDNPTAWVRRVALNRLSNHFRKIERGRRAQQRLGGQDAIEPTLPEIDLVREFKSLPDRQRTAAALYYIDGFSVNEIADAMGIAAGTAKRHLYRAREALRVTMEVT